MHEMGIATSLVDQLLALAERHGASRIDEVEVEVGLLQQVVPEALELAFAAASAGTPAEGAQLKLIEVSPVVECRQCGHTFEAHVDDYLCPRCQQADVRVVSGQDIVLRSIVCRTEAGGQQP